MPYIELQRPSQLAMQITGPAAPVTTHKTQIIELLNMGDYSNQQECAVGVDNPLFQPLPPSVEFRHYEPFSPVTAKLSFRNMDKFPRRVRVIPPETPFFSISPPRNGKGQELVDSRIAPGTEVHYTVTFNPRDVDDYSYEMIVVTEREKYIVPLRAMGKRGLLSFPDAVSFASTAVKSSASKTFVVRNTGTRASEFSLSVPPPYRVAPERGFVDVDQNIPVTITFTPTEATSYTADMLVSYPIEGYEAVVGLSAAGHDVALSLSTHHLEYKPTYVTLSNQHRVVLRNDSDLPVTFAWKAFADAAAEQAARTSKIVILDNEEAREVQAVMDAPDDDALDLDGDGEDDLSDTDSEDEPLQLGGTSGNTRRRTKDVSDANTAAGAGYGGATSMTVSSTAASSMHDNATMMMAGEGDDYVMGAGSGATSSSSSSSAAGDGSRDGHSQTIGSTRVKLSVAKRAAVVAVRRKYRSLKHAAETEPLDFNSEVYDIQPRAGTLWARSAMEFTIVFAPNADADFATVAHLDVTGRSQRLPLALVGKGNGPKLTFTYDVVDVGEVTVTSRHRYELKLMNKGEIDAEWSLHVPRSLFGTKFQFEPASGFIRQGEEVAIDAYFCSEDMGEFKEEFRLHMAGTSDFVKLRFLGRVVPPSFQFDVDVFDFGNAPFSFTHSKRFALYNTSDVPFSYALRVPQDGATPAITDAKGRKRSEKSLKDALIPVKQPPPNWEFALSPPRGTIAPGGFHSLEIYFTPTTLQTYNHYNLVLDIDHVGTELAAIPMRGACVVADVEVSSRIISFGECFMRHAYTMPLTLKNNSDVPARFEVLPQDSHSAVVAAFAVDAAGGVVPPNGSTQLKVSLTVFKPGPAAIPVFIRVLGKTGEPLKAECQAFGRGPRIIPTPSAMDWAGVTCLVPTSLDLTLYNDSFVPAPVQLFMKSDKSRWSVEQPDLVLAPGEHRAVKVTAVLDDTVPHSDDLCINIAEAAPILVPLTAKGTGTSMVSDCSMESIDFGQVFTSSTGSFVFTMENKGRRAQVVAWSNMTQRLKEMAAKNATKQRNLAGQGKSTARSNATGATGAANDLPEKLTGPVFSIEPNFFQVKPRGIVTFTVTCSNAEQTSCVEQFECSAKPEGDVKAVVVYTTAMKADFVHPLLQFDRPDVLFRHLHTPHLDVPEQATGLLPSVIQSQPITMTNLSGLPLEFTLRSTAPFSLDAYEFTLEVGGSAVVNVSLDPLYRDDRQSHVAEGRLSAIYKDHPRRDGVPLIADINFPNLAFERTKIDFGCVLNDTTSSQVVRVTNTSKSTVDMNWTFVEDSETALAASQLTKQPYVPINQVFDILPIRCTLEPGQSQPVEFVFYGHPGRRFDGKAICEVAGGPDYEVDLVGEASIVAYRIDRSLLDYGRLMWDKAEELDLHIHNSGKVDYAFSVATDTVSRAGVVAVNPSSGTVPAGEKQRLRVLLRPGVPGLIKETIVVSVAHFAPVEVTIVADAVFGIVSASLPREPGSVPGFDDVMHTATETIIKANNEREAAIAAAASGASTASITGADGIAVDGGSIAPGSIMSPPLLQLAALKSGRSVAASRAGPARSVAGSRFDLMSAGGGSKANHNLAPVLPLATQIEAEACRMLFASLLMQFVTAERQLAIAERSVGINRKHAGLGLDDQGDGSAFDVFDGARAAMADQQVDGNDSPYGAGQQEEKKDEENSRTGAGSRMGGRSAAKLPRATSTGGTSTMSIVPAALLQAREAMRHLVQPSKYVVAKYVLEMGNVVIGTTRKKQFTVTNSGRTSASFNVDRSSFAGTGFNVEPGKVQRLPEGESCNFEVAFTAAALRDRDGGIGMLQIEVPVYVAKGPAIVLCLRANVTVPDVKLSPEVIDFSSVLKGQEKVIAFQVHNFSPVVAAWNVGHPVGAPPQVKDKDYFKFEPTEGQLQPGERCMVKVSFAPTEVRGYGITFPIRIAQNQKNRQVVLRGRGDDVRLTFAVSAEQDILALANAASADGAASASDAAAPAPVSGIAPLPAGLGSTMASPKGAAASTTLSLEIGPQVPNERVGMKVISITNTSAVPVEVFSLDFDSQYKAEEGVLALCDGYDDRGILRVPARQPGTAIDPSYVSAARSKDVNAGLPVFPADFNARPPGSGDQPEQPRAASNTGRMLGTALNVVLIGPPGCGVSTQARAVSEALQCPVTSLDAAVEWARSGAGGVDLAVQVNHAVATAEAEQRPQSSAAPPAAAPVAGKKGDAKKPDPKAAAAAAVPAAPAPAEPAQPRIPVPLVAACLAARVMRADCGQAVVVDGLACKYLASNSDGAAAIAQALNGAGKGVLRVVSLTMNEPSLAARYASALARLTSDMQDLERQYHLTPAVLPGASSGSEPKSAASRRSSVKGDAAVSPAQHAAAALVAHAALHNPYLGADGVTPLPEDEAKAVKDEAITRRDAIAAAASKIRKLIESPSSAASFIADSANIIDHLLRLPAAAPSSGLTTPSHDSIDVSLQSHSESKITEESKEVETDATAAPTEAQSTTLPLTETVIEVPAADSEDGLRSSIVNALPQLPDEPSPFTCDLALPPAATFTLQRRPAGSGGRPGRPSADVTAKFRLDKLDDIAGQIQGNSSDVTAVLTGGDFQYLPSRPLRWVLQPGQTAMAVLRFASGSVGAFNANLGFGVVGVPREFTITARGQAAVPTIVSDPVHFFGGKVKSRGDKAFVAHKFVVSRGVFEFGPLMAGRSKKDRHGYQGGSTRKLSPTAAAASDGAHNRPSTPQSTVTAISPTSSSSPDKAKSIANEKAYFDLVKRFHSETVRVTNNGPFPATIAFALAGPDTAVPYHRGAPYVTTVENQLANVKPGTNTNPGAAVEQDDSCFVISPAQIEALPPGHTAEVTVWSFPSSSGVDHHNASSGVAGTVYMNTLVATIGHNPEPVAFPISAVGTSPCVELHGPWEKAGAPATSASSTASLPAAAPAKAAAAGGKRPGSAGPKGDGSAASSTASLPPVDPGTALVDFERQLVEHSEDRSFTVTNTSLAPIHWRIDTTAINPAALAAKEAAKEAAAAASKPADPKASPTNASAASLPPAAPPAPPVFRITPTSGTLGPGQTATVSVNFASATEILKQASLAIEYTDTECGFEYVTALEPASRPSSAAPIAPTPVKGAKGAPPAAAAAASASSSAPLLSATTGGSGGPRSKLLTVPFVVRGEAYRVVSGIRFEDPIAAAEASTAASSAGASGSRPPTQAGKGGASAAAAGAGAAAGVDGPPGSPSRGSGGGPGHFDFGLLRVGDASLRTLPLSNMGKYPITYKVALSKPPVGADVLAITPSEGTLQAGESVRVEVTLKAGKEIRLSKQKLLTATICDARSGEVVDSVPISISAATTFSKQSFVPSKGLNFGALRYGQDKERKIEIKNVGPFPFSFNITPAGSDEDKRLLEVTEGRVKADGDGAAAPPPGGKGAGSKPGTAVGGARPQSGKGKGGAGAATGDEGPIGPFGRFTVEPVNGTVQPGATFLVSCKFFAAGANTYRTPARIHISGFDHVSDTADSLMYELVGESCVPGINATDWDDIFEEQTVVTSIDELALALPPASASSSSGGYPSGSPTASPDSSFNESKSGDASPSSSGSTGLFSRTRAGFSVQDRVFSFGTVIPTQHPRGVVERFRISNPTKIPITVRFELKNDDGSAQPAFAISPSVAEIPMHESRYVDVRFTPTAIRKYTAVFSAEVDGGTLADSRRTEFSLSGEGALPSISVVDPGVTARDAAEGILVMDLGRVQAGKGKNRVIAVRNDGVFPAIARFELPFSRVFKLTGGSSPDNLLDNNSMAYVSSTATAGKQVSLTLQPGQQSSVGIAFSPDLDCVLGDSNTAPGLQGFDDTGAALYQAEVKISVLHNPYEQERVRVKGTACVQDVVFEGVAGSGLDMLMAASSPSASSADAGDGSEVLVFKEVDLSDEKGASHTFTMVNKSDRPIRFEWPGNGFDGSMTPNTANTANSFTFSPRAGHLPVGARKSITVTFTPGSDGNGGAPIKLENFAIPVSYSKITYDPAVANPASEERRKVAEAAAALVRPGTASSQGTKTGGKGGKSDPKAAAKPDAKAAGKSDPKSAGVKKSGSSRPSSGVMTSPKKKVRRPRGAAPSEPRHEWDSNMVAVRYLPTAHPQAVAALQAGTGQMVDGGSQVRVSMVNPEPNYAVIDDGELFMDDEEAPASGSRPGSGPATPSSSRPGTASTRKDTAAIANAAAGIVKANVVPVAEETHKLLSVPLTVKAVSDAIRYELPGDDSVATSRSIAFKATMMYQTRQQTFTVKNPAITCLRYSWSIANNGSQRGSLSPFTITPSVGVIAPGDTATFTAVFSPMEAQDFDSSATCSIDGLAASQRPLTISMSGRAQRPIVHMDVPASTYLSRRNPSLVGPNGEVGALDASVRVVDVPSLGVGVKNTRRFFIVNPTTEAYDFMFEAVGQAATPAYPIKCLTPRGMLPPGKRFEVSFEYTPVVTATCEGFFRFAVPSHNLTQLFLVAGTVSEPRVSLDRTSLQFRHLLIGAHSSETVHIVNEESVPFAFDFLTTSYEAERTAVTIVPSSGVVPANGRLPIEVTFAPTEERLTNANISCAVKRKPAPLRLNLKGEGYQVHDRLSLEDEAGASDVAVAPELTSTGVNFLDFGTVQVNERAAKRVVITNSGAFGFDFSWAFAADAGGSGAAGARALAATLRASRNAGGSMSALTSMSSTRPIKVTPEAGKVPKGGSITCEIEFRPTSQVAINNMALLCTVANVKRYQMCVSATGGRPALEFSAHQINFGECILPPSASLAAVPVTKMLRITNREADRDISLQCLFDKKPHLDVGCDALVLRPGDSVDVPFTFTPRQPMVYTESVPFEVNGLHTVNVSVSGEGVPCSIELVNPSQADLSFGALRPGQSTSRSVKIANKCKRGVIVEFVDDSYLPTAPELAKLASRSVALGPKRVAIRARDTANVDLKFTPASRIAGFKEPVFVRVAAAGPGGAPYGAFSDKMQLFNLAGACLGLDVMLEVDTLTFGSVCEGAKLTKSVQIYNGGDVPTQFKFDTSKLGRDYSIQPAQGFLAPQSDVAVAITFAPTRLGRDIRVDGIRCAVEGVPDPLFLSVTGDCVARPATTGTALNFACKVRETATATISLPKNDTDKPWTLAPVISNDFWSGPVTVEVPAKGTATYPLTYKPLLMTKEGGPVDAPPIVPGSPVQDPVLLQVGLAQHTGTVFLPLPDGSGMLYQLVGKAAAPSSAGVISQKTPAKKVLNFTVPVNNWMRSTQRFVVSWDAKAVPPSAQLKGARTLDVPGLGTREYKLSYLPALEGKATVPLTLTNEQTGEYLTYSLELEASAPGTTGTIALESVVRQSISHTISIPNPLAAAATPITWSAPVVDHPAVRVVRVGEMTGQTEGLFRIDYRPLMPTPAPGTPFGSPSQSAPSTRPPSSSGKPKTPGPGSSPGSGVVAAAAGASNTARIQLHSDQLGDFQYEVKLTATATGPEPGLRFNAPLGGKQASVFRFRAFDVKPGASSTLRCSVNKPDVFTVPATFTLAGPPSHVDPWGGVDGSVEVVFEGVSLGDTQAEMTIVSEAGSTYTVPLQATCLPPRPAGPFTIAPMGQTTVDFRNIFNDDREFLVTTDNPSVFQVTPSGSVKVAKKSSTAITVKYLPPEGVEGNSPGGKLVIACPSSPGIPPWLFYLKGEAIPLPSGSAGGARVASAGAKRPDTTSRKK